MQLQLHMAEGTMVVSSRSGMMTARRGFPKWATADAVAHLECEVMGPTEIVGEAPRALCGKEGTS